MKILLILFLIIPSAVFACDPFADSNNPAQNLPTSWADVTTSGQYATPVIDGVWVDVHVHEYSDGTTCQTAQDEYSRRYCTITGGGDDPETPDVIEPYEIRAVFSQTYVIECPEFYSYDRSNDICVLVYPELCIASQVCSDGSPIIIDGWPDNCDRPELQQCEGGSWVEVTDICPGETQTGPNCTDYQTCLEYAVANTSCSSGYEIEYIYIDPINFSTSCVQQSINSPDLVENGGNGNGNPYDDPGITPNPDGTIPTVEQTNPSELADAIDSALQDNFSQVERAVRDRTDQIINELNQHTTDLNNNNDSNTGLLTQRLDHLIQEQQQTTGAIENQTLQQSMNSVTGPCDPTLPDYLDCLSTNSQVLPDHEVTPTFSESLSELYERIQNSQLITGLLSVTNIVQLSPRQCVEFGFIFPLNGEYLSTDIHCQIGETIRPILSLIMLVVWTIIGFKIFVSA